MKRNLVISFVLALAVILVACGPATGRHNRYTIHSNQDRDGQFLSVLPILHRNEQFRRC